MTTRSFTEFIEVNPKIAFEKDKEYPFVEMSNVGILQREPEKVEIKRYGSGTKFQRGDTVVARIEPCLQNGKGFFVKNFDEGFGSTEFLVFRSKDENKLDNIYLYYLMQDQYIRECMIRSMTGATGRQRVNNKVFENIKVNIPKLYIQKKIAYILSSYDDLIENNLKRIKLLEEAAELIYKEWFVNFRFPGYEKCEFVDGVPYGWIKAKVGEHINFIKGKKPKLITETINENSVLYLLVEVLEGKNFLYTEDKNLLIAMENEVIMIMDGSRSGTIYKSIYGAIGSTMSIIRISNDKLNDEYLYYYLKSNETHIKQNNTGSAIPHANKEFIKDMDILIPEKSTMRQFNDYTRKISKQISILKTQNNKLKEARDILIPKLIMGEIEV